MTIISVSYKVNEANIYRLKILRKTNYTLQNLQDQTFFVICLLAMQ